MSVQLVHPFTAFRRLTYLLTPNETMFSSVEEVPDMVGESAPYFFIFIILELFVSIVKGKRKVDMSDNIGSITAGLYSQIVRLFFRSCDFVVYCWTFERFSYIEVPWNSAWTWLLTLIGVDFCYYWLHRAAHEINFMWTGHQVHHSSEYYNLTTALRQSVLQPVFSSIFYMPLALFVPPQIYLVHAQLSLLYQFWIHTELVESLGPLEWLLNTPSHHRVHHGRNPYCIDKNYGAVLIIWDRLFGTFAAERKDEPVSYGLVHPLRTLDPQEVQLCHLKYVARTMWRRRGFLSKLKTLLCGPGWVPGTGRLGDKAALPAVKSAEVVYRPQASFSVKAYCVAHFALANAFYVLLLTLHRSLPPVTLTAGAVVLLLGLTAFGNLLDARSFAFGRRLELARCLVCAAAGHYLVPRAALPIDGLCLLSFGFVLMQSRKAKPE